MRICHVIEAAGAGTGQVVADLARLQRAEGHEVTVVYAPARAETLFLEAIRSVEGLKIYQSPMFRHMGIHDPLHAFLLWRLLRRIGPFDILHGHSSKAGGLTRLIGFLLPQCKVVYTPHAFVTMGAYASLVYRPIEFVLSFFCDAIVATSEMEKEHAIRVLHIKPEKVHVVLNGIRIGYEADRKMARLQLGFGDDVFLIGFVGRLAKQKNLPRLLDAFGLCKARSEKVRLAILGDGECLVETEQAIIRRGWQNEARIFSGLCARDFYPAFDVFVNSSDYESFGLILIEAMDAGVPVVTTKVGIAEKAIVEDETGWLCDFEASDLARGAMKAAALSEEERAKMAHAEKRKAASFSDEEAARNTMRLYQSLCGERK